MCTLRGHCVPCLAILQQFYELIYNNVCFFFLLSFFRLNLATDAIQAVADDLDRAIDDLSSVSSNANVCMGSLAHSIGGG